jgi:hypothetical protein
MVLFTYLGRPKSVWTEVFWKYDQTVPKITQHRALLRKLFLPWNFFSNKMYQSLHSPYFEKWGQLHFRWRNFAQSGHTGLNIDDCWQMFITLLLFWTGPPFLPFCKALCSHCKYGWKVFQGCEKLYIGLNNGAQLKNWAEKRAGLPDGIFSNQKSQFGYVLERFRKEKVGSILWPFGVYYGHLVHFVAIWYILW